MLRRSEDEPADLRRASAAARLLDLRPVAGGEMAVALQVADEIARLRGEIRIVRVGTAWVAVAGTEALQNEVGGDGPDIVQAIVACAADLVRYERLRNARPDVEPDADDSEDASLFSW
jgi:hypothetical protein